MVSSFAVNSHQPSCNKLPKKGGKQVEHGRGEERKGWMVKLAYCRKEDELLQDKTFSSLSVCQIIISPGGSNHHSQPSSPALLRMMLRNRHSIPWQLTDSKALEIQTGDHPSAHLQTAYL
jgi:hypothetical protein